MGLAIELLAGALVGSATGRDVRGTLDSQHPASKGDLFIAIDPGSLAGSGDLAERAGAYLDEVRSSRPIGPAAPPRIPGDRARACRAGRLTDGIVLSREAWEAAIALREPRVAVGATG
ncbi:MAG: Ldh family oxidoreductase [Chloroflexi bacterium]|nr:Ldh family oxidoreductase [Chloroflexota bacterium]